VTLELAIAAVAGAVVLFAAGSLLTSHRVRRLETRLRTVEAFIVERLGDIRIGGGR
jgi:hypothetical protein